MLANIQTLEKILGQVKQLPPEYRLRLVQRIVQTLIPLPSRQKPHPLRFGEFESYNASMYTTTHSS